MTTEKGKYPMMTFTDEHMNRLFEKFILEYYKKEFPQLKAEAKQISWAIDDTISTNELLPIMQTDIMLHFKNGKTLIIDAKYYGQTMQYHFNKATIHSHNLYQIHTYVINQDKNHEGNVDGMLLYAKTEEEITPNGQIHLNDGNVISFKTLDLNQDFHQIKKRLNSFISNYMVR
jgi:5-methylcytosine-specific restriction enzyme subunit McrC